MMSLRFYYARGIRRDGTYGDIPWRMSAILHGINDHDEDYAKYLGGAFHFDVQAVKYCDEILDEIEKVQSAQQEKTGWSGNAFDITIYRDHVDVNHQQFAGHPDWPTWTCSLAEFKTALQGWKRFLEMPVSLESEVVVELPSPAERAF